MSWLYNELTPHCIASYDKWDQRYIKQKLRDKMFDIRSVADRGEVVSYKWDCKEGVPEGAKIICFHGKPRPKEVAWLE